MHSQFVKHVISPLHESIFRRKTFTYLTDLEKLQWVDSEKLAQIRFRKLKALLLHAKETIPFYKEWVDHAGFDPLRMQAIEDIRALPLLSKADIRKNLNRMKWAGCPGGLTRFNTGGSSGEPLVFYFDKRRQAYDKAARAMTHRWWNIDIGDKELYLWGSPVEISKQDRLKAFRDWLTNERLISAFEISAEKIPEMVQQLKRFRPACVFGYPSTISLFCKMANERGFSLASAGVSVVFSTAEVLYKAQKETISRAFGGIPVVDGYGSREAGFISHECPHGNYHVMDPNYIVEYIKEGKPVGPGEDGEVVITHLDAWGMPFIRYRTGDVAQQGEGACQCGRVFSTMKHIRGRTTDFIVTPDGRWQHALSLIYIVRDIEGVDQFKIIQEDVAHVRVLLKIHERLFPESGHQKIVDGFRKRMGDSVQVTIERVDDIARDASGKYRYVVSKVAGSGTGFSEPRQDNLQLVKN
ncbi:MAG: hypothetical protein RBT11_00375 [Desulfobacterales bacterium]|jgi:phenylacetate-CoA ligase|nr:hypothetical protein [Desulfobacterales bacterium]